MSRDRKKRQLKPRIFFFVEGKTEKVFFEALSQHYRLAAAKTIKIMDASGLDWVDKASSMMKNDPRLRPDDHTQVFIIFDKDDFTKQKINQMMKKADRLSQKMMTCQLGFSNRSFEVWLLAHYQVMTSRIESQVVLNQKLSKVLGTTYIKGNSRQMEHILADDKVYQAIDHTKKIVTITTEQQAKNIGRIVDTVIA